ncbi:MAG: right-handed parallel beta-helix repeat-containing protein [Anaerolineae bacterium]
MKRDQRLGLFLVVILLAQAGGVAGAARPPAPAAAAAPLAASRCPALRPTAPTVQVSTEAQLRQQATDAAPGTAILIAPGTYHMQDLVYVVNDGVSLFGQTGNRDDVILDFDAVPGTPDGFSGIQVAADDVTVANLTIRYAHDHGVAIQGSDRPVLYNLHVLDVDDQLIKVNPEGDGSDDGLLACSRLEYTTAAPDEYTNGISAHDAHGWTVRDNEWYRIRTPEGSPVPTILFWRGSSDTVVERNLLVDCYQGIAFGNADGSAGEHTGGVVRNNVIYASLPHDVVIEMVHASGWLVAHNTALLLDPAPGLTWGMEARYADSTGTFAYNLTNMDIWLDRDGAGGSGQGNVTAAQPGWFADAAGGDLHLRASATQAIDQAAPLAGVDDDYDGQARPIGPAPDVGADEYGAPGYRLYLPLVLKGESGPPPGPTPGSSGLIQPSDLTYRGAFRLPETGGPDEESWTWATWASALAYYPLGDPAGPADGYPGSLFGTGHDWNQWVSEVSIPPPVISAGKDVADLNTAQTLQPFADVKGDLFGDMEMPRVGLAYLPAQGAQSAGKLYFAWAPHLDEGATNPSHGWSELDLAHPQPAGPWRVGNYWNYVTGDYLFDIPADWAAAHTPGLLLATGRYRDGGQGAQGPSLLALGPWNEGDPPAAGSTLPATPLLLYSAVTDEEQHVMDGYHHSDEWTGGAWLTTEDSAAVLLVGTKGTGECWSGCADGTLWEPPYPDECPDGSGRGWWSTGFVARFAFYDPADLAAVASGQAPAWQPQPYATLDVDEVLYHVAGSQQKYHLGAAAFDRARGLLYVLEVLADDERPLVHVWHVD